MPETRPVDGVETGAALRVGAVVLAAGASRRLGQPKQLLPVAGESLVRRTARLALEVGCAPVVVVLGFEAERVGAALAGLHVATVVNAKWSSGMGSSLACGVAAARRARPEMDALLVLVCDQPRLSSGYLRRLLAVHASGLAVVTASAYSGRAGVPAVFSAGLFEELERIEGDRGARELIARHGAQTVDWSGGAWDIDWPEDLLPESLNRFDPS
jgi:molybdenum cofactor cytidylyltransferase